MGQSLESVVHNSCSNTARAEYKKLLQTPSNTIGEWSVGQEDRHLWDVYLESDDFTYDVRLYINGDFATKEDKIRYAQELAFKLNLLQSDRSL